MLLAATGDSVSFGVEPRERETLTAAIIKCSKAT